MNTEKISEHTVSSKGGDYRQKKNERLRFAVGYRLFLGDGKLVDIYIVPLLISLYFFSNTLG